MFVYLVGFFDLIPELEFGQSARRNYSRRESRPPSLACSGKELTFDGEEHLEKRRPVSADEMLDIMIIIMLYESVVWPAK